MQEALIWVVPQILGPFWLQTMLGHLIFRGTRIGRQFWELPICSLPNSPSQRRTKMPGHAKLAHPGGLSRV